jgi:DMSO/TMAO reductase YedYZ heme-binding membrane subunit
MLNTLYRILGKNLKLVQLLFRLSYLGLVGLLIWGIWAYSNAPQFIPHIHNLGAKLGTISTGLLIIALLPGILKRLGVLRQIGAISMLFRRQFGILAFFTAAAHLEFSFWIKRIVAGESLFGQISIFKPQLYGFSALAIFALLWLLSNDYSMKLLGKWWLFLQRLAYLAGILIVVHIILVTGSKSGFILGAFLGIEGFSWVMEWWKKRNSNQVEAPQ